jgi:hypothetical protein
MKKITFAFLLLSSFISFSQVTLINPNTDGGFEVGPTFADNGWTAIGPPVNMNRRWYCGTGQPGFTGARCAFIGNNTTTVGTATGAKKVHLYKSITIPAGATNIILSFKYKQEIADYFGTTYYDYVTVSTGSEIPVTGDIYTNGTTHFGPFPDAAVPTFTTQTVTLPNSLAGTTTNLIFSFICDNVDPVTQGAVDDVLLTYTPNLGVIEVNDNLTSFYPNPVKNTLYLVNNEKIEKVEIFNLLGQSVLSKNINAIEGTIDVSDLADGSYIVKIKLADAFQSITILKE